MEDDHLADEMLERPAAVRRAAQALAALGSLPPFMVRGYPLEARRMARRAAAAVAELLAAQPKKIATANFSGSVTFDRLTADTNEKTPQTLQRLGVVTPAESAANAPPA